MPRNGSSIKPLKTLGHRLGHWLLIATLIGNLAAPGLAQAWIANQASFGNDLIAICSANGIRLVSLSELAQFEPEAGNATERSADYPDDQTHNLPGHCQHCLGSAPEQLAGSTAFERKNLYARHLTTPGESSNQRPATPRRAGAMPRAPPAPQV